jgi:1-acyl-sn-glycerol-3-phosphate acyltransferase
MITSRLESFLYHTAIAIIVPTIQRRYLGIVTGLEYLPRQGPFVLVANHTSAFDHLLLGTVIKIIYGVKLHFLAKKEFFEHPVFRIWHNSMGSIPVNREGANHATYRRVMNLLSTGQIVCIYPEGSCGTGKHLLPFKQGAFRIATRKEVPIIPVGITGAHQILPKGAFRPRRYRASLAFGQPLIYNPTIIRRTTELKTLMEDCCTAIEHLALSDMRPTMQPQATKVTANYLAEHAGELIEHALQTEGNYHKAFLVTQALQMINMAQSTDPSNTNARVQLTRVLRLKVKASPLLGALAVAWHTLTRSQH